MKVIEGGNYAGKSFTMSQAVTVRGGNFMGCSVENPEAHPLILEGGNLRGLVFDGVAPTGPQDLPAYVELDGAAMHYGFAPPQHLVPLPLADEILQGVEEAGGMDARAAWLQAVQFVHDNPTALYSDWLADFEAWAATQDNMTFGPNAFKRIRDRWFTGMNFQGVRNELLQHSVATWSGEATQEVQA